MGMIILGIRSVLVFTCIDCMQEIRFLPVRWSWWS